MEVKYVYDLCCSKHGVKNTHMRVESLIIHIKNINAMKLMTYTKYDMNFLFLYNNITNWLDTRKEV